MILEKLYNSIPFLAMKKSLDASSLRQKVIANNIANVDTPHFKRSEVRFEDEFKKALEKPKKLPGFKTDAKHFPINPHPNLEEVKPTIWRQNDEFYRSDDNDVDIETEMAELAKNSLKYEAVVERISRMFSGIKRVIRSDR